MAKRKTPAELRAENRILRQSHWTQAATSVVTTGMWAVAVVLVARYGYLSVDALAGDRTVADIGIRVLGDLRISTIVSVTVGIGGAVYGWLQRRLRKSTVERLASRNQDLERGLDPERSTSGLTPRGDTPS